MVESEAAQARRKAGSSTGACRIAEPGGYSQLSIEHGAPESRSGQTAPTGGGLRSGQQTVDLDRHPVAHERVAHGDSAVHAAVIHVLAQDRGAASPLERRQQQGVSAVTADPLQAPGVGGLTVEPIDAERPVGREQPRQCCALLGGRRLGRSPAGRSLATGVPYSLKLCRRKAG